VTRALVVEADGGSRGNPGPAGYGALVTDAATGEILAELCDSLGTTTNNVAEYSGLVAGLRAAADLAPGADVAVRMDSKLVVEQMSGRWQIKDPNMRKLAAAAREVSLRLGHISYTWIPRARNTRADRLANQAMDAAAGRGPRAGRGSGGNDADDPGGARSQAGAQSAGAPRTETSSSSVGSRAWGPSRESATTTLLLRHGETPLSAERRFAGSADIPLTAVGRRQATAAAARLAARGGIGAVLTSPLRRARITGEAVAAATGAPLVIEAGLAEADFGKWEGLSFAEAAAQYPDELSAWLSDPAAAPPGGESFAAVAERVIPALDRLIAAYPARTVVVTSHVTPIKTLLCHALLAPSAALFRIHLDVSSLSEIEWFAGGPAADAVVRSVNDTAHVP
jgi:ribonuclease H / adenosylcobalamin/alpha-ribazole phosphatase